MTFTVTGVPVSPGRVAGVACTMPPAVAEPSATYLAPGADLDAAAASIASAAVTVQADLFERAGRASGEGADVLTMTAAMASDPTLAKDSARRVREERATPTRAVWDAANAVADQLERLGGMMAERAPDVRDVRDRIVAELSGLQAPGVPDPGYPFILVAHDLAPADTATLDPATVLGIVTSGGGPTSHTAILARSLGIPAVVAAPGADGIVDGQTVLIDGSRGTVEIDPAADAVAAAQAARAESRVFTGVGATKDGHRVQLLANVADPAAAAVAIEAGAEGVGLFRTEFCFLGRTEEPTIEEQVTAYRGVLAVFAGKKVVVRTLDAGADKPLPFVTAANEPNPALGVRGLRTSASYPDVLDRQLQAIALAAAQESAEVWVMAPMVATVEEAEAFAAKCAVYGIGRAGVMIEIPAAALQSRWILQHVTFASLGTNDLTQYAMAADRELGDLAALSTSWQPAVLALIKVSGEGGAVTGHPIGVCGEAAADPALAPVLVGLGVASLSMTPRALADVAAVLSSVTYDECVELARIAVDQPTAGAARDAVRAALPVLEELGL